MDYLIYGDFIVKDINNFSNTVKNILQATMGLASQPISIKGSQKYVNTFVETILQEKRFLEKYLEHGKEHSSTQTERALLEEKIENFENSTGIVWPLGD